MSNFFEDIKKFNAMYKMPKVEANQEVDRLIKFLSILNEELEEMSDVIEDFACQEPKSGMVCLADLLGDIVVYCSSEAERFGFSLEPILQAIMESNFSKLNDDGTASYDERGKLLKGPNFFKPEAKIAKILVNK